MSTPASRSRLEALVAYGPVILLVAVAALQVWCASVDGRLTPAKGGGFGLFSTVDKLNNRHLRVSVVRSDGDQPLAVPASVRRDARALLWETKSFPTAARLRAIARTMAAHAPADTPIRVEVSRMTFDGTTGTARFAPVAVVGGRNDGG